MKAMKKVLALALALAMVVTAVPVTSAKAADISLKAGKSKKITYYVGKTNTVNLTGVTASKVKSTTWSKNGSKALNLKSKAKTSVKVQLVKAGTAKVTASVKLKSGKTKKYTVNITVKNPTITAASAKTVTVGDKISVKATGVKPASATVEYSVADPAIATVDAATGEVTGVKAGTTKVTAKLTCGTTVKEVTTDVTVKNVLLQSVTQKTANTIEAVVLGNTKELKKTDFVVTNTATKAVVAVDKIAVDSTDATKVTITTFAGMTDGKVYSVALDGVVKEFTATDGKVATLSVTPTQIPSGVEKEIKMVAKDAAGIVVYEAAYGKQTSDYSFTIETKTGYTKGTALYLTKTGDTAVAKVTKHSFKYDTTGKEIETIESGEITITAVDPAAVSGFQVRIADDGTKEFDDLKDNAKLPVGGNKVAMFKITDANNEGLSTYTNYSVASSDPTVMQIAGQLRDSKTGVSIYGLKEGTAYILIKDAKGNVVASLPITVVATAKPATLTLDKTNITVSNVVALNDKVKVTATVNDQYGEKFPTNGNVTVTCTAKPSTVTDNDIKTANKYYSVNGTSVTFKGVSGATSLTDGTYVYKVEYTQNNVTTAPAYVTVLIKKAEGNINYVLEGTASEIDTKITDGNDKIVTFTMYQTKGDVKSEAVTGVSYEVKKDGKTVTDALITTNSEGQLVVKALDATSGSTVKKLTSGTYTIIGTYTTGSGDDKTDYTRVATLVIKDSQAGLTVTQKAAKTTTTSITTGSALLFDAKTFELANADADKDVSGNAKIKITKVEGACAAKNLPNGSSLADVVFSNTNNDVVTITKVTAEVTIKGVVYEMSVDVNYVVTVVSSL